MESNSENNKWTLFRNHKNKPGLLASFFYIFVILLLGVPIWYKTTTPSRHSLPDISSLLVHSQMISNQIPVTVISVGDQRREALRDELISNWKGTFRGSVSYTFKWKIRQSVAEEKIAFASSSSLREIDERLNKLQSHNMKGHFFVFLIPENTVSELTDERPVLFGASRFVYISVKTDELEVTGSKIDRTLAEIVVDTIDVILEPKTSTKSTILKADSTDYVDTIKLLLNNEIDVLINVITEDIEEAIRFQNSEKLQEMKNITNIAFMKQSGIFDLIDMKITSQMVHCALTPKFFESYLMNASGTERLFKTANVPQLLNAIESRIVEHNNKQSYHLTVIIASSKVNAPLFFFEENTAKKSNAVITPYRGGILVWNNADDFNVGFKTFMRCLIGLSQQENEKYLTKENFFSKWELDAVIRQVTLLRLSKTLSSLESIEKLLDKVSNIVILEEIAKKMHFAVEVSHQSIDRLAEGNLEAAFQLSSKAYEASETAFFDPSLLALLYFPDDQKYAVYFPLFLPVSLPLIASIHHIIRSVKK